MIGKRYLLLALSLLSGCAERQAPQAVSVAVAANFAGVQEQLAQRFTAQTGDSVRTSVGPTGQLYAQIRNGAPFDVLLSADAERPRLLEQEKLGVADTRFTYAVGRLVLFAPQRDTTTAAGPELLRGAFQHLAIANPQIAPYGAAAMEVLRRLDLDSALAGRLVQGESIAQALQFVNSGAAELGFVALAQVVHQSARKYWLVPDTLHSAIVQDAILLSSAQDKRAARAYLEFLRSSEAQSIIRSFGYDVPAAQQ